MSLTVFTADAAEFCFLRPELVSRNKNKKSAREEKNARLNQRLVRIGTGNRPHRVQVLRTNHLLLNTKERRASSLLLKIVDKVIGKKVLSI